MATEARKRATAKYDKNNTVQIHLKLNLNTDADILEVLERTADMPGGKQGFIKALIRKEINR